jgi:hypothetical protein
MEAISYIQRLKKDLENGDSNGSDSISGNNNNDDDDGSSLASPRRPSASASRPPSASQF